MRSRLLFAAPLLAALLLLGGAAAQQSPVADWQALADAQDWTALSERARVRLAEGPDAAAEYWLSRAELEQARGLPFGGTSGHFRRRLFETAAVRLEALAAGDGPWAARALELWLAAAWAWGSPGPQTEQLAALWEERAAPAVAWVAGLHALDDGQPEEALAWFDRARHDWPERGDLALARAEALGGVGEREAALQAWRDAVGGAFPSVVPRDTLLEVVIHLLPESTDAAARLAELDRLVERPEWRADGWLAWHRAFALDQLGRTDEAVAAFDQATEGRTARIERAHAMLLARTGRPREGVALLRPLAQERDWEAFADLVTIADELAQARRWDEALWTYEVALGIEPRDERALRNRAITLWRTGQDERAAKAWQRVLELLPGRSDLLNDAALAASGRGEPQLARTLLEQAAALPGSIDARENLAVLLLDAGGEGDEVLRLVEGVLAEQPQRPRALRLVLLERLARSGPR